VPYVSKAWKQYPDTSTPETAAALIAMETRAANYVGAPGLIGPGVLALNDFRVASAGTSMVLTVGPSTAGYVNAAFIALDALGGTERYETTGQPTVTIGAADATNPRIDRVVLTRSGVDSQAATPGVIVGTPSSGATLDNLTGAAAIPVGSLLLADVLVPAGAVVVASANVRDRRSIQSPGASTPLAPIDVVTPLLHPAMIANYASGLQPSQTGLQLGVRYWLPRRVLANVVRWKYSCPTGSPAVGAWNIGIYDESLRKLAETGSQAWANSTGTLVLATPLLAGVQLEAGPIFIVFGMTLSSGTAAFVGTLAGNQAATPFTGQPGVAGVAYIAGAGGVTLPQTFIGQTDVGNTTVTSALCSIPQVSLSQV
jgi:hypothetical protein